MKFINLTKNDLFEIETQTSIPRSGIVAFVRTKNRNVTNLNGIKVFRTEILKIVNLPEPVENTIYIVPALVLNATDRPDVVAPGHVERDENHRVIGCRGFRQ